MNEPVHHEGEAPDELIRAVVHDALGGRAVAAIDRVRNGFSNRVYTVRFDDHDPVVVRVHEGVAGHFDAETWALGRARLLGVPVPVVIAAHDVSFDGIDWSVAVHEFIPGSPMPELSGGAALGRVAAELGSALAALHSHRVPPLGTPDSSDHAPETDTVEPAASSPATRDDLLTSAAAAAAIDPTLLLHTADLHAAHSSAPLDGQRVLLHGDFVAKNVLCRDPGVLAALLDFEFSAPGDPAADLAYWRFHEALWFAEPTFPALLTSYESVHGRDEALRHRLDVHELRIALQHIRFHGPRGEINGDFRRLVTTRMKRAVDVLG